MAETKAANPTDDLVELELPEEIRGAFAVVEAAPPAEEQAPVKGEERKAAPPPPATLVESVERGRQAYQAKLNEQRAEQEKAEKARQQADRKGREKFDYNKAADWNQVVEKIREELTEEFEEKHRDLTDTFTNRLNTAERQALSRLVTLSEELMVQKLPPGEDQLGFYQVVEASGVMELIGTDNGTQEPKDSYLHNVIYGSVNPAAVLYEYAREKLGRPKRSHAPAAEIVPKPAPPEKTPEERARDAGRREVLETVERAGERPKSIAGLPSSNGRVQFSLSQIAGMTDEAKKWLKKNRPDIWGRYLQKPD